MPVFTLSNGGNDRSVQPPLPLSEYKLDLDSKKDRMLTAVTHLSDGPIQFKAVVRGSLTQLFPAMNRPAVFSANTG